MQEWMLAMLVISITLIIRDMAKTILAGNGTHNGTAMPNPVESTSSKPKVSASSSAASAASHKYKESMGNDYRNGRPPP